RGGLVAPGPVADRDTDALVLGKAVALLPDGMLADALEAFAYADNRELPPAHAHVAFDDRVLQPELDRVEAELRGELVEHGLQGEGRRRRSRPAIGAERDAVRLDAVPPDGEGLPPVRPADQGGGDVLEPPLDRRPSIADDLRFQRGELTRLARADAQLDELGRCRVRRLEV